MADGIITSKNNNFKSVKFMEAKIIKMTSKQFNRLAVRSAAIIFISAMLLLLNFLNANAANYYWVGGSGNWSDVSRWATNSGGSTFHTQPPTANDDVYFDGNSGSSFTVSDLSNAIQCKSLVSTVNVSLDAPMLVVYGSLKLFSGQLLNMVDLIFMGSGNNTIETSGGALPITPNNAAIKFDCGTGSYNVTCDINNIGQFFFSSGRVTFSGNSYGNVTAQLVSTALPGSNIQVNFGTANYTFQSVYLIDVGSGGFIDADSAIILIDGPFICDLQGQYFNKVLGITGTLRSFANIFKDVMVFQFEGTGNTIDTLNTPKLISDDDSAHIGKNIISYITSFTNNMQFEGSQTIVKNFIFNNYGSFTINESDTLYVQENINLSISNLSSLTLTQPCYLNCSSLLPSCITNSSIIDVNIIGNSTFYADTSCTNLGGNTGWTWAPCSPTTASAYYWVGGSGNWSDVSHWATTSGGTTFHTQPPTANDDVYFDANSFSASGQIVSITPSAQCKNFDAQSLGINTNFVHNNSISVSGSFLLSPNVTWSGNGSLFFKNGGGANTVSTPNNSLGGSSIFFQSQSSSWNVLTDLSTTGTINVDSGIVTFNNIVVNANELRINTLTGITDSVKVYLGASNFNLSSLYFVNTPPAGNVLIDGSNASIVVSGPNPTFTTTPAHYHYIECAGEFNSFGNGSTIVDSLIVNSANAANLIADYVKITGTPLALPCGILSNTGNPFIKKLELASQASMNIAANHLFIDTLIMSNPTGVLNFLSIDTITINHQIVSASFASNLFTIQNTGSTTYFDFAMQTPVCLDYLNLQNINAINNNSVYAGLNSNDLGGNIGWNFASCPPPPVNYYWVGGTGNWSDVSHWATTSGGTTYHTNPPDSTSDVYFDVNSFISSNDTVITSSNVKCHSFTDSGLSSSPVFYLPLYSLSVYGSLNISGNLKFVTSSIYFLSGYPGNTVNTNGYTFTPTAFQNFYIIFDNPSGTWQLQSDLNTGYNGTNYSTIRLKQGSLLTNGYAVSCYDFDIFPNPVCTLMLDTSSIYCDNSFYALVSAASFNLDADSSKIYAGLVNLGAGFSAANHNFNYVESSSVYGSNCNFNHVISGGYLYDNSNIAFQEIKKPVTAPATWIQNLYCSSDPTHFQKMIIYSNPLTWVSGNKFTVDTLELNNPNDTLSIQGNDTIVVTSKFTVNSSAGAPVYIKSNNAGVASNFDFGAIDVCVDYLSIKENNALGIGNHFAGANSIDLGNNSGWQFSLCSIPSNVWPGDANYDLTVNNNDVINIGLAFSETGPVRAGASLAYTAQPATDWNGYFQTAVNKKHADTNGDGVINDDDTTAISLNYGLTHPARLAGQQSLTSPSDPYLYLDVTPDSTNLSDTVYIETYYGTAQTPVDSVYGIAFTINYDTVLVDTNWISTQFLNSWLGQPGFGLLTFQKSIPLQGKIDLAMVRTDHLNVNGFGGPLCRTGIVIVDNVAGRMPLPFTLSDPFAITASEFELGVNLGHDTTLVDTSVTTGVQSFSYQNFNLHPNPSKDFIVLKSLPAGAVIEVYNLNGEIVLNEKSVAEKNKLVDIRKLNKGIYNIRIYNERKMLIGKIVKL